MEWGSLDWNSTTAAVEALLEKCSEQSGLVSKFLLDNCVLPAGQYLLANAERAVQYTLNGEYEVGCASGTGPGNMTDLSLITPFSGGSPIYPIYPCKNFQIGFLMSSLAQASIICCSSFLHYKLLFYFSQAVQEVTLTSLHQTLSWLDLSHFQVRRTSIQ